MWGSPDQGNRDPVAVPTEGLGKVAVPHLRNKRPVSNAESVMESLGSRVLVGRA